MWYGKYDDNETSDEKLMKEIKKLRKKESERDQEYWSMTSSYVHDDE